ncbi:putative F-box protein PP2-B12 [Mercurialis annua]|uniref:putative F-box protein PP2-B12 n=1 Tax=Mercurialis annua TaxID=3986 RepID=UPI00216080EB|nr:putative F-box protein PP2-B12 [Mercurialis annua]
MGGERNLLALPEDCIADILSFTGPLDACKLSTVSSSLRDAAQSDAVWKKFLPSDYESIILESSDSSLLYRFSSKKQLYLSLCHDPLLIDSGKKSFALDKWTGKKCYMISARDLKIIWSDTPAHWRWISLPDSRFSEVAELISICWLEISAKIHTNMLSPSILYTSYLVFKSPKGAYGFEYQPAEVIVRFVGRESGKHNVYMDAERGQRRHSPRLKRRIGLFNRNRIFGIQASVANGESSCKYPKERGDGWLEIELGDYFNKEGEDGELEMSVLEVKGGHWKGGLVVQGIEIRPKYTR